MHVGIILCSKSELIPVKQMIPVRKECSVLKCSKLSEPSECNYEWEFGKSVVLTYYSKGNKWSGLNLSAEQHHHNIDAVLC